MRIMATCVHHARSSRTVRNIAFLLDRQGIDICSHSDDRRLGVRGLNDIRNDTAVLRCNPMRNPSGGELFAQIICGREFLPAKLRVPMEMAPDLREPGNDSR